MAARPRASRRQWQARAVADIRRIAAESAAIRRVALLVARAASPEEVFAAVAVEAGRLPGAGHVALSQYEPNDKVRVVAAWSGTGAAIPVGTRMILGGRNVHTLVFQTGRAARMDDYAAVSGAATEIARQFSIRAAVAVPVSAEGRLWGVMSVASTRGPLPAGTEARLAAFIDLAATAIANAQAHMELRDYAGEQAALRRVAVLVARGASPDDVFAAIAAEAGKLLGADFTAMARYDPGGGATFLAQWVRTGAAVPVPLGTRFSPGGRNVHTMVFQTCRPARIDNYIGATGTAAEASQDWGLRAVVGVPVSVGGQLWGVIGVGSRQEPLLANTEGRLADFADLASTAIVNAETQGALAESRARIVAAADQTRRRVERDLHDGAQQRLVSLTLHLREARAAAPAGAQELAARLDDAVTEVTGVLEELREIARGLHPAALSEGGLGPALGALARRSAVPVDLDVQVTGRLPETAEVAAYYAVAEAVTNTAKHARASVVKVEVAARDRVVHLRVSDDGRGGADFGRGSGLVGLKDRVEALGGRILLDSPPGSGTVLDVVLPLDGPNGPADREYRPHDHSGHADGREPHPG
jgi:signal transduction histidine kinase